jgi:hypothetical protein
MWSRNCLPYRSTWVHSRILVGFCCSIFSFLHNVLCIIVCRFTLGHCIVCPSIRGFWLLLWYLQNFLVAFYICRNVFISYHRGCRGRMLVGFITTYAVSTYHYERCEFESHSSDKTLCDKVCRWLTTSRWFYPAIKLTVTI